MKDDDFFDDENDFLEDETEELQDSSATDSLEDPDELPTDNDDDDFDIEIVDDAPPEDQGKPDDPDALEPDDPDNEAQTYSRRVQKRIDKLTALANTERRAREKIEREKIEALSVINKLMSSHKTTEAEMRSLRERLYNGEKVYVTEMLGSLETQLRYAQERYKQAYELGQTDDLVKANQDIASLTQRLELARQYRPPEPPKEEPEVPAVPDVKPQPPAPPPIDSTLQAWMDRNPWFNDPARTPMRGVAMAIHGKLVEKGIHPQLDAGKYYQTIDSEMRKRFPDYRWPDVKRDRSKKTNTSTGTRTSKPRQIRLTKSQVSLAESLGLSPEQYAAEVVKLEARR